MQATYLSLYHLPGITSLPREIDIPLPDVANAHAVLTQDGDALVAHLINGTAASMMYSDLGRLFEKINPADALKRAKAEIAPERWHGQVLLAIKITDPATPPVLGKVVNHDQFSAGANNLPDQGGMVARAATALEISFGAIALGGDLLAATALTFIGTTAWITDPVSNQAVYETLDRIPRMYVLHTGDMTSHIADDIVTLAPLVAADPTVRKLMRSMILSSETAADPTAAFMMAWATLEAFVTSFHPTKPGKNAKSAADDNGRLMQSFRTMETKLRKPGETGTSQQEFWEFKGKRNAFFHELTGSPTGLPSDAVRKLLRKVLRQKIMP